MMQTPSTNADGDAYEGQGTNAGVPASGFLESNGIGLEEQIEDAVYKGHVDGDWDQDRLLD